MPGTACGRHSPEEQVCCGNVCGLDGGGGAGSLQGQVHPRQRPLPSSPPFPRALPSRDHLLSLTNGGGKLHQPPAPIHVSLASFAPPCQWSRSPLTLPPSTPAPSHQGRQPTSPPPTPPTLAAAPHGAPPRALAAGRRLRGGTRLYGSPPRSADPSRARCPASLLAQSQTRDRCPGRECGTPAADRRNPQRLAVAALQNPTLMITPRTEARASKPPRCTACTTAAQGRRT